MSLNFDFSHFLLHPETLGNEEASLLSKKLKENPWVPAYHILLARANINQDSFQKSRFLKQAATYTGDREQLFNWLHLDPNKLEEDLPSVQLEKEPSTEPIGEVHHAPDSDEATNLPQALDTSTPSGIEEAESSPDAIKEPPTESISAQNTQEQKVNERTIDLEEVIQYDPLTELKPVDNKPIESENLPLDYSVYNPEVELTKLSDQEEEESTDFMYWINHLDDSPRKKARASKSPDKVQELLDHFLATKRSRPMTNRSFYKAEMKAKESEEDKMDVLSESLLKLYEQQGYYEKALEGYRKISLQYPEKSAYFAAQISALEEKIG